MTDDFDLEAIRAGARSRLEAVQASRAPQNESTSARPSQPDPEPDSGMPLLDNFSSVTVAERFLAEHGDDVRFVEAWGKWLVWNGRHWELEEGNSVTRNKFQDTALGVQSQECRVLATSEASRADDKVLKGLRSRVAKAVALSDETRVVNVLKSAGNLPGLRAKAASFDMCTDKLATLNGVLNLHTGVLEQGRQDDLLSKCIPVSYVSRPDMSEWHRFLDDITCGDLDLELYLQKMVGAALLGDTKHQRIFFLVGGGLNGKSTFVDTIMKMLGPLSKPLPKALILQTPAAPTQWDIAGLHGARMLVATEIDDSARLSESLLKELTSQEPKEGAHKFQSPFTFELVGTVFVTMNHKPTVTGTDKGIWRRIVVIPFDADFEGVQDAGLGERLKSSENLSAVLYWAAEGARLYLSEGLGDLPKRSAEATSQYRTDMDTLGRFLSECTTPCADKNVRAKEMYDVYRAWAKSNGHGQLSNQAFGRRLTERKVAKKTTNTGAVYTNLELTLDGRQYAGGVF